MPLVKYDDLSEDVQLTLAQLENDVHDLKFESHFYRGAVLIAFVIAAERIWERLF